MYRSASELRLEHEKALPIAECVQISFARPISGEAEATFAEFRVNAK